MGNKISTPKTVGNASYPSRKFSLPTEIWFEVLAFVKFHEAPNIFLVNRYFLQICQVYFHSGTVGLNKYRNVRDLGMQLMEGSFTISIIRNGILLTAPVPEVDPPKVFNAFGYINVEKCCRIEAIQFLNKYQSLLTKENNEIIFARNSFVNNDTANVRRWFWQRDNSNARSNVVIHEKQLFLNWIGQKKVLLKLEFESSSKGVARILADEPLIAQFKGRLSIKFKNERNLCGLEEDAKLIYGWISSSGTRELQIRHYDAQKARELACQIALLFEQAHESKIEAEKMDLKILLPNHTVVPMHEQKQKVCNGFGDQLATLRTFSAKCSDGYITSVYAFYTKSMEYLYKNEKEFELSSRKAIYFL